MSSGSLIMVADPDEYRRNMVREKFGFPKENCFVDAEALSKVPKFADAVINGTMDEQHVKTSIPLLKLGYDMLLEKPFCVIVISSTPLLYAAKTKLFIVFS